MTCVSRLLATILTILASLLFVFGGCVTAASSDKVSGIFVAERDTKAQAVKKFIDLCSTGTPEAVRAALKAGADPNASLTKDDKTITALSASTLNLEVFDVLISAGAKFDKDIGGQMLLESVWFERQTYMPLVQKLIAAGADVNAQDSADGQTPLHYVLMVYVNEAPLDALLAAKADVNIKDKHGNRPFSYALEHYSRASGSITKEYCAADHALSMPLIDRFIKAGADVNTRWYIERTEVNTQRYIETFDSTLILLTVASAWHPEWVVSLLDYNPDMTAKDSKGKDIHKMYAENEFFDKKKPATLFEWLKPAVEKQEHMDMLIKAGIAPAGTKVSGATAPASQKFIELCGTGTPEAVRAALKAGADPNASLTKNKRTRTALSESTRNKNLDVFDVLISAGAKFDKDIAGQMLLESMWFVGEPNMPLVQKLIAAGADVNIKDKSGNSPFSRVVVHYHGACYITKGYHAADHARAMALVDRFIKAGADVNTRYSEGISNYTLLLAAVESAYHPEWVVSLLDYNPDMTAKDLKGRDIHRIYAEKDFKGPDINKVYVGKPFFDPNKPATLFEWLKPAVKKQEHIDMLIKAGIAPAGTKSSGGPGATAPAPVQPTAPAPTQPAASGGLKRNPQPAGDLIPRIKMGGGQ